MSNEELIDKATSVLNRYTYGDRLFGDVGAAVVDENDEVYLGVCIDTPSWGLCAERSAIAAMVTNKQFKIKKVVAVWRDEREGRLHVVSPCGHCRQFMQDINEANLDADIILGSSETVKLKELLPRHEWPQ